MRILSCLLFSSFSKSNKIELITGFLRWKSFSSFKFSLFLLFFLLHLFKKIFLISSFESFNCWPWNLFWRNYWINNVIIVNLIVSLLLIFFLLFKFHLLIVFLFELILLFNIIFHSIFFLPLIFHLLYPNFFILLLFFSLLLKPLSLMTFNQFFIELINFVDIMTDMIFIHKLFMQILLNKTLFEFHHLLLLLQDLFTFAISFFLHLFFVITAYTHQVFMRFWFLILMI